MILTACVGDVATQQSHAALQAAVDSGHSMFPAVKQCAIRKGFDRSAGVPEHRGWFPQIGHHLTAGAGGCALLSARRDGTGGCATGAGWNGDLDDLACSVL